jgi:protease IV
MADENWQRMLLEQLARDALDERRRARRWGILWKSLAFGLLFAMGAALLVMVGSRERICLDRCTALVEVRGELDSSGRASAERVNAGLQAAFKNAGTKGVVVRVNSPGGSPVQAGQIYDEMRRLRAANPNTPLYVVVDEIAASGGYYVAAAGDRIYVDKASIVGSIGVIMQGFGLGGAIEKLGIERRVYTAGENKSFLDPFEPVDPKQRAYVQKMLDEVHEQFIAAVKEGRGSRLKEDPGMFSGLVWHGKRAVELGLADGFGNLDYVAREVVKAEEIVDFTPEDNLADRVARRFGATMFREIGTGLLWARPGVGS